jgi:hypothetical protein
LTMVSRRSFNASPSAAKPTTDSTILAPLLSEPSPPILNSFGAYRVLML